MNEIHGGSNSSSNLRVNSIEEHNVVEDQSCEAYQRYLDTSVRAKAKLDYILSETIAHRKRDFIRY